MLAPWTLLSVDVESQHHFGIDITAMRQLICWGGGGGGGVIFFHIGPRRVVVVLGGGGGTYFWHNLMGFKNNRNRFGDYVKSTCLRIALKGRISTYQTFLVSSFN